MIKIWQFLIHSCWHNWQLQGKGPLTYRGETVGQYYCYKCSKCERVEERMPL